MASWQCVWRLQLLASPLCAVWLPPSPSPLSLHADLSFNRLASLTSVGSEGHCSCCTLRCLPRLQALLLAGNLLRTFPRCALEGCMHAGGGARGGPGGPMLPALALLDLGCNPGSQGVLEVPWDLVHGRTPSLQVLVTQGTALSGSGS